MSTRPGDPRFYRLLDEIGNLHARKSSDYAPGADPLANFRASAEFGVRPYLGVLTRLRDKWGRITTAAKGAALLNESIKDSHIDSAVYHLIAIMLLEDEAAAKPTERAAETPTARQHMYASAGELPQPKRVYVGEDSTDPDRDCIISHV